MPEQPAEMAPEVSLEKIPEWMRKAGAKRVQELGEGILVPRRPDIAPVFMDLMQRQMQATTMVAQANEPQYRPDGLPVEWDYETAELGPQNQPLPQLAQGWLPNGKADYGPGIAGILKHMWSNFTRPPAEDPGPAFIPPWEDEQLLAAGEEASKMFEQGDWWGDLKHRFGALVGYTMNQTVRWWNGLEDTKGIGWLAKGIGGLVTGFVEANVQVAWEWERQTMPKVLAAAEIVRMAQERAGEDVPDWLEWHAGRIEKAARIPWFSNQWAVTAAAYSVVRHGLATQEEYEDLQGRYKEAARMGYSAWADPAKLAEFQRKWREGADPRLLAMELADPGMEAIGQTLNDPMFIVGIIYGKIKALRIRRVNTAMYATAQSDDLMAAFGRAAAAGSEEAVGRAQIEVVDEIQRMYNATRNAASELAQQRGITVLTARGKRVTYAEHMGNFYTSIIGHRDPDAFLETLRGLVLAADPDPRHAAEVMEGLARLNATGISPDVLFSPAGNETAVMLRGALIDDAGNWNPARLISIIDDADDAADLARTLGAFNDEILARQFTTVTDQIALNDEYLRLLDTSVDDAAEYLARHPAADVPIEPWRRTLNTAHQAAQKMFYRPVASIQGTLYMGTSPSYFVKNRWGNTMPIFADIGPEAAGKALFGISPKKSVAEILNWTGDAMPEAAMRGIGAIGGAQEVAGAGILHTFSRRAATDEATAAAHVMATSLRDNMGKSVRLIGETTIDSLTRLSGEEQILLSNLLQQNYGNVDDAVSAFMRASVDGNDVVRNLTFLSDDQLKGLRTLGVYDETARAIRGGETLDDMLRGIDDVSAGYRAAGDAVSTEAALLDVLEGEAQQVAMDVHRTLEAALGSEAADAFGRRVLANEEAIKLYGRVADDIQDLASRRIVGDTTRQVVGAGGSIGNGIDDGFDVIQAATSEFRDRIANETDNVFAAAREFTRTTWGHSDWSLAENTRGLTSRDLQRRWIEIGIAGTPPSDLTRRGFRDALWETHYYPSQQNSFTGLREFSVGEHTVRANMLAEMADIAPEELASKLANASAANVNARMFDDAVIRRGQTFVDVSVSRVEDAIVARWRALTGEPKAVGLSETLNRFRAQGAGGADAIGWLDGESIEALKAMGDPEEVLDFLLRNEPDRFILAELPGTGHMQYTGGGLEMLEFKPAMGDAPPMLVRIGVEEAAQRQGVGTQAMQQWVRDMWQDGHRQIMTSRELAPEFFRTGERSLVNQGVLREAGVYRATGELPGYFGEYRVYDILEPTLADEALFRMNLVAPMDAGTPSLARMQHEVAPGVEQFLGEIKDSVSANYGTIQSVRADPAIERQLASWADTIRSRVTTARAVNIGIATQTRDFILHNYGKRYGIDLLLGYIYPYQFWHSRSYLKWMKRLVTNPFLTSTYGRYRGYLENVNAGLPDWWKYNINVSEALGLDTEHPLWFNLEQTLNPLQGLTGVDFNDPKRRLDWFSGVVDDLNKFGPSIWTPYQLAIALKYHADGEDDAASRWAGRLWTPTRTFRDLTALAGFEEGKGIELDPFINYFSGGLGPYERGRAGRMLGAMVGEGQYSEAEIVDAGYRQEGAIWDEAVTRSINIRAPNLWTIAAPFFLGSGFKPRTQEDIEIDRMYNQMYTLFNAKPNMSPEEYRTAWNTLEQQYPFMDTVLLSRKSGMERDEALAWNILDRIPPGQADDMAEMVGISYDLIQQFQESKGELALMSESERMHFMAGMMDLGALLDLPDGATRQDWDTSQALYRGMMVMGEQMFGDDIWEKEDAFWATEDKNTFLRHNPVVEQAMDWKQQTIMTTPRLAAYYSSVERIEKYFKGLMYEEAEKRYGENLWALWDVYHQVADADSAAAREMWKDYPQLGEYLEFRDGLLQEIAERVTQFGSLIPEARPPEFREGMAPEEEISYEDDEEAWVRGMVLSYLAGGEGIAPQPPAGLSQEQLQQALGESGYNLLMDYLYLGEDIPEALRAQLEQLGMSELLEQ